MIELNTADTFFFNLGIDLFAVSILALLYSNYKKNFADTYGNGLLRQIQGTILAVLATDAGMWLLNGQSGLAARVLNYATNIAYFILQLVAALYWLKYTRYRACGKALSRSIRFWVIHLPFALVSLLVLSAPLNGWCFSLDNDNFYHRGFLSYGINILILCITLGASVLALLQCKKESLSERKKELHTIAFFVVPPFCGGIVQLVFYGFSIVWPCAVFSCLLVILDKYSQAISQDPLTGLNNRRTLERYLLSYDDSNYDGAVAVLMLDVNDFKYINDAFGHSVGDFALTEAAAILRRTANEPSTFLARYGGDEFVVVLRDVSQTHCQALIQQIKDGFVAFNQQNVQQFRLSVSIGYAFSAQKSEVNFRELLKQADEKMYRDKAKKLQGKKLWPSS